MTDPTRSPGDHPAVGALPEDGGVRVNRLIHVCGLKRSGLHGVSFWMLRHSDRHALLNNSPAKRPGSGSYMSRTVQTSPLPVRVHRGLESSVIRGTEERFEPLPSALDLLIVLHQSQQPAHLAAHQPLVQGVNAAATDFALLLRDPFNWAASYMHRSQNPEDPAVWPLQWREYAQEYLGLTRHLTGALRINYNDWFSDPAYRQQLSGLLGFAHTDSGLQIVSDHADGSSFDRRRFDGNAQEMDVLGRWKHFADSESYKESFRKNRDILEMARSIFRLPPDLTEFAASLTG